ncbi:HdeD family acid-resistance protein [Leptospira langatensis]|nr:DUF308 domain-containing protein [Leptospira langatensis]
MNQENRHWWLHILIGAIWFAAGISVILFPVQSYLGIALAFSVILILTGSGHLLFAFYNRKNVGLLGWNLALGILDLAAGILLTVHPEITVATLPFVFGMLLIFRSVSLISFAIQIHSSQSYPWGWVLFSGILTLAFAVLILFFPLIGILTIVFWTGVGFMTSGLGNLYFGWKEFQIERASLKKK